MKIPTGYRFTLQWAANTPERIAIGELLEQLGNKKSVFVLSAISALLNAPPEGPKGTQILTRNVKHDVSVAALTHTDRIVPGISEQKMADRGFSAQSDQRDVLDEDVVAMLDNLDQF